MAGGRSKAVWAVVLGVLAVLTMPVAIGLTRYSGRYDLVHAAFAIPIGYAFGWAAILRARRARALGGATLGRPSGRRWARLGRLLGVIGICMASSALIAVAVYGVLVYAGGVEGFVSAGSHGNGGIEMTDFVDKDAIGLTGPQYHVGVSEGEISDIVLMPGDPFRVQLIADMLDDAVEVAHKREYRTMNGTYKGRLITVCSSGMGCPSTAIGVEELARVGGRVFIRVGSTAALQPHVGVGDVIVSEGSLRNDGTTAAYVPPGYPAVPDFELTVMLKQVADELGAERGFASHAGLNATDDAFYAETPEWITNLTRVGMLNVEMESSALFVVARLRGLRAGMVCAVSANLVTGDVVYGAPNPRLHSGWERSIEVALEAVHRLGL